MTHSGHSRFAPSFQNKALCEIYNYFRDGKKEKALEWLANSIDSSEESSQGLSNDEETLLKAVLCSETRALTECVLHASSFVDGHAESDTNNVGYAHYILALAKREMGDIDGALESFSKASSMCKKKQVIYL